MGNRRQYKRKKSLTWDIVKRKGAMGDWKQTGTVQLLVLPPRAGHRAGPRWNHSSHPAPPHNLPWAGDHRAWFMQTRAACMHSCSAPRSLHLQPYNQSWTWPRGNAAGHTTGYHGCALPYRLNSCLSAACRPLFVGCMCLFSPPSGSSSSSHLLVCISRPAALTPLRSEGRDRLWKQRWWCLELSYTSLQKIIILKDLGERLPGLLLLL